MNQIISIHYRFLQLAMTVSVGVAIGGCDGSPQSQRAGADAAIVVRDLGPDLAMGRAPFRHGDSGQGAESGHGDSAPGGSAIADLTPGQHDAALPSATDLQVPVMDSSAPPPADQGLSEDAQVASDTSSSPPVFGDRTLETVSGQSAYAVVVSGGYVYWAELDSSGTIRRQSVEGGPITTLVRQNAQIRAMAVDETRIYWTSLESGQPCGSSRLLSRPINGGTAEQIAQGLCPGNLLQVGDTLYGAYWTRYPKLRVFSVSTAGGDPITLAEDASGKTRVQVNDTHLYWVGGGASRSVRRIALAGGSAETYKTFDVRRLDLVSADNDFISVGVRTNDDDRQLRLIDLRDESSRILGSGFTVAPSAGIRAADTLYFGHTGVSSASVYQVSISDGKPPVRYRKADYRLVLAPYDMALSATDLYVANPGSGGSLLRAAR